MNNFENGMTCEIIQDLLPLYHDGVCSEKSKRIVEDHIKTCHSCREMLNIFDTDETEETLKLEGMDVLKRHAKSEKSMAVKTGLVIAGILLIPIIIALLLTLPGYSDVKTDAVLIASMLLVAGLTVVPLLSKTKKLSKTILFSTAALLLIIFFVEMLFDNGGWIRFGEIAFSTVFGLSLVLAPFVIGQLDLPNTLVSHKALIAMTWYTIWFYLMLFIFAVANPQSTAILLGVSTFFVGLTWLVFVVIRYLKTNGFFRSAIAVTLIGIWTAIGNHFGWITIYDKDLHFEILVVTIISAAVLAVVGILWAMRKHHRIHP